MRQVMTQERAVLSVFYDATVEWLHRDTIYARASKIWHFGGIRPQGKADRALDELVKKGMIERCGESSGYYRLSEANDEQQLRMNFDI